MQNALNNLYEEIYGSKLKPQDLLNNLELDNYHEIKFTKKGHSLVATVICDLNTGERAEFKYIFKEDKLEKLIQLSPTTSQNILYDRKKEIYKLRKELQSMLNKDGSRIA